MSKRILFLCNANSIRSPMAEALFRMHAPSWEIYSAGAGGAGSIYPMVEQVLLEHGADPEVLYSKDMAEFVHDSWDYVVAMTDLAAKRAPLCTNTKHILRWNILDPTIMGGDQIEAFRKVRDQIEKLILELLRSN